MPRKTKAYATVLEFRRAASMRPRPDAAENATATSGELSNAIPLQ